MFQERKAQTKSGQYRQWMAGRWSLNGEQKNEHFLILSCLPSMYQ